MNKEEFRKTLAKAVAGDLLAQEYLLELYTPLITKYSYIENRLDEDLMSAILFRILKNLPSFRI